jgi:hypothetical protein
MSKRDAGCATHCRNLITQARQVQHLRPAGDARLFDPTANLRTPEKLLARRARLLMPSPRGSIEHSFPGIPENCARFARSCVLHRPPVFRFLRSHETHATQEGGGRDV